MELLQSGVKYTEQELKPVLTECFQRLFPEAIKKKSSKNKKKVYPLNGHKLKEHFSDHNFIHCIPLSFFFKCTTSSKTGPISI